MTEQMQQNDVNFQPHCRDIYSSLNFLYKALRLLIMVNMLNHITKQWKTTLISYDFGAIVDKGSFGVPSKNAYTNIKFLKKFEHNGMRITRATCTSIVYVQFLKSQNIV